MDASKKRWHMYTTFIHNTEVEFHSLSNKTDSCLTGYHLNPLISNNHPLSGSNYTNEVDINEVLLNKKNKNITKCCC